MDISFMDKNKFFYNTQKTFISTILKKYNFLHWGIIGKSLCGRNIDYIRLGNADAMTLWVSAHHGMEWITSILVLKFLESICEKIQNDEKPFGINLKECFHEKGLLIIPCLNPDGVEISLKGSMSSGKYFKLVEQISKGKTSSWQANARGVDLNHNYDANWKSLHKLEQKNGIFKPAPTRYGGMYPHSEPETIALTNFCNKNNFLDAFAFHSQGEEIYWDFQNDTPIQSKKIANILAISSGYKVSSPEGLAVGGGFKDWFIQKFKRPAFTIEVGKGKNPLPITEMETIYKKIEKMLYISAIS